MHSPTKDIINPVYHTIMDDYSKKPLEKPIDHYEEVIRTPEVEMMMNPAYAKP